MRIALAQSRSKPGDVHANIVSHCAMVDRAAALQTELIVFPELSITGYEPTLARQAMRDMVSWQLHAFQTRADAASIQICFGAPIVGHNAPRIGAIVIRPGQPPICYSKMFLHQDELPFFEAGDNYTGLIPCATPIGLAICYELSVSTHVETVFNHGARIYLASVAKSLSGVRHAAERLTQIAAQHNTLVMMVNGVGPSDNFISSGKSAVWDRDGSRLAELDEARQGILHFDTTTLDVVVDYFSE